MFLLPLLLSTCAIHSSLSVDVIFDISSDETHENIIKDWRPTQDISELSYITYADARIVRVNDGAQTLWVAEPGTHCENLTLYSLYDSNKMASIRIPTPQGSKFIWFENLDSWAQLTDEGYAEAWKRLKTIRKIDLKDPINYTVFSTNTANSVTGTGMIITTNPGYQLKAVLYDEVELWISEEDVCDYIMLHGDLENPKLINISVSNDLRYNVFYFHRDAYGWERCSHDVFMALLINERARLYIENRKRRREPENDPGEGPSWRP